MEFPHGLGQEPQFARTVVLTFRRRFYRGSGHSIRDVERCFIGLLPTLWRTIFYVSNVPDC
jgi:hypothetical protein